MIDVPGLFVRTSPASGGRVNRCTVYRIVHGSLVEMPKPVRLVKWPNNSDSSRNFSHKDQKIQVVLKRHGVTVYMFHVQALLGQMQFKWSNFAWFGRLVKYDRPIPWDDQLGWLETLVDSVPQKKLHVVRVKKDGMCWFKSYIHAMVQTTVVATFAAAVAVCTYIRHAAHAIWYQIIRQNKGWADERCSRV